MKKFALVLVGVILFVAGCAKNADKVSYLEFTINDEQLGAVVKLKLTPDYEKRTFDSSYIKDFEKSDAVDSAPGVENEDIAVTGSLGGENFEKFEEAVELVKNYDPTKTVQVAGVPNFKVVVVDDKGMVKSVEVVNEVEDPTVEKLKAFYLEWTTLLVEDGPAIQ